MRLWVIYWQDAEGSEKTDHVAAPSMDNATALQWVLDYYRQEWNWPDMKGNDVFGLDYYELTGLPFEGTDGKKYNIKLEEAK